MSVKAIMCAAVFAASVLAMPAFAAGTEFSYQGELMQNGNKADGTYNLRFSLWNALSGGTQIGSTILVNNAPVVDGKFTVVLDFGFDAFDNGNRWIEVRVNSTTLSPRQPITASPFAIKTRGLYVNENESFVGVGRSYKITSAEKFGIHMNTSGFGGMYMETGTDGEPFYGYSRNGSVDAYHYFDSASDQWRLWANGDRLVVNRSNGNVGIGTTNPNYDLQIVGDGAQSLMRLTNGGGGSQNNTGLIIGDVTGSGRAASLYGVTSNDLFRSINDGVGEAAIFSARDADTVQITNAGSGDALEVTESNGGIAIRATNNGTGSAYGLFAYSSSSSGIGAYGQGKIGMYGFSSIGGFDSKGVYGVSSATDGVGVHGRATSGGNSTGIWGTNSGGGWAGFFGGSVFVEGNFTVGGSKNFMIDNPLNPSEEYLVHACIESDAMRNLYDGTVVLDERGEAIVELPEWFEALNGDFRYQLTCIGGFAQVYVAREIEHNAFTIAGGPAGMKVSWQVTGVRIDPAAQASDFQVIKSKADADRGTYLCPEGYGQPASKRSGIIAANSSAQ